MTDLAVVQRRLMLSMGETNRTSLTSVKGYLFRTFFIHVGGNETGIKKHEHGT